MFNTVYADENQWQEKWKKEYKYGVLLFVPPEPILSFVTALREKYDPIANENCIAHISLTMPLKRPLTEEDIVSINKSLSILDPFEVNYGPIINFLPDASGIVFAVSEQDKFLTILKLLEASDGLDFYPRKYPFKAHMTVAEFVSAEETLKLTEKLNKEIDPKFLKGKFICDCVSYMVPNQDFVFEERIVFSLGAENKMNRVK